MKNLSTILATFILSAMPVVNLLAQPGTIDGTFGTAGKTLTLVGNDYAYGEDAVMQPDGKIVVAGYCFLTATDEDFMVVRYNSDGTLDNTFSSDGKVTTDFNGGADNALAVALQADGKILIGGLVDSGIAYTGGIARYNSDGSPDNTFSGDGKVLLRFFAGTGIERLDAMIVQADGKILIAGSANDEMLVARLNSNGSLDMTFNGKGWITFDFAAAGSNSAAIGLQADGKIVVGGNAMVGTSYDFAVARLNTNGTLDNTFSSDGKATVAVISDRNFLICMALQADGKIVAAGYAQIVADFDCALMRLNADGTLDNAFSGDGKLSHGIIATELDGIDGIVLQPDGKILATGFAEASSTSNLLVVRYLSDGSFDNTFATSGKMTSMLGTPFINGEAIALQKDGKIIIVGSADNSSSKTSVLVTRFISGLTVSVGETFNPGIRMHVYPNPFSEFLSLDYRLEEAAIVNIRLYDIQGRLVNSIAENKLLNSGEQTETVDLQYLPQGLYHLVICIGDSRQTYLLKH